MSDIPRNVAAWPTTFLTALSLQIRVVATLILREARTRFGHSRLGYLWALAEPVGFILILSSLYSVFGRHANMGVNLFFWFFTGIIPYFLFNNLRTQAGQAVAANRAFLFVPLIKPMDTILARASLELLTSLMVFTVLMTLFYAVGLAELPVNPLDLFGAIATLFLFGFGFALVSNVMSSMLESWHHVMNILMRPQYLISGVFLDVEKFPSPLRDILLYNPIWHCIAWFRLGFFPDYSARADVDPVYALTCSVTLLLIGLLMERLFRKTVTATLAAG
jgi:capsular polysaccharide transport system permease protein